MRIGMVVVAMAASLNLAACQTVDGVPVRPAQGDDSFCGRNTALCVAGGILLVGGIVLAASHGGGGGGGGGGY